MDLWLNFEGYGLREQGNKQKEGVAAAERQEELEGDAWSTVAAAAEGGCGPGWGQKRVLSSLPKPRHAYRNKYI
ncbi:hypothetical protein R1flu_029053 [Riccia fluitans]|uniref:Uncharacterized protein n=1 Tax=Riccia fluitans TaxID=41844 RepID=A0ABD1XNZ9_9MARC